MTEPASAAGVATAMAATMAPATSRDRRRTPLSVMVLLVGDQIEPLPGADRGAVRDQWHGTHVVRTHVLVVGPGQETDRAVGIVDEQERLPRPQRRPVGDQRLGAGVLRRHIEVVGPGPQRDLAVAPVDEIE